ncbi:MAG TPA: hypothetical protein PL174_06975 [Fervidobacterium sp.]|nr:hypothetical protein [Fervidobacterium sp.]HOH53921.1 hypothetical protein [Fervidobacterium sp.]HOP82933.1 hypothetical protein [Fervidobacterium sp.]HPT59428.1 hypothetical protein [Fervidobacterium sp.]HQQ18165.1 hypothetical protein [Fervidobacterium sp.]
MSKKLIRILFYGMAILSVFVLYFASSYLSKVKKEPLAVIEGIDGGFYLDDKYIDGPLALNVGKYEVIGESKIALYSGKVLFVKIPQFEVEIVWEK